jgi:hypothetical protein
MDLFSESSKFIQVHVFTVLFNSFWRTSVVNHLQALHGFSHTRHFLVIVVRGKFERGLNQTEFIKRLYAEHDGTNIDESGITAGDNLRLNIIGD